MQKLFHHPFTNAVHIVDCSAANSVKGGYSKCPGQSQNSFDIIVLQTQ